MAPNSKPRPRQYMTRQRVKRLILSSRTKEEWIANRHAVIAALGYRPPYWAQ
jgi:hypothetical protein